MTGFFCKNNRYSFAVYADSIKINYNIFSNKSRSAYKPKGCFFYKCLLQNQNPYICREAIFSSKGSKIHIPYTFTFFHKTILCMKRTCVLVQKVLKMMMTCNLIFQLIKLNFTKYSETIILTWTMDMTFFYKVNIQSTKKSKLKDQSNFRCYFHVTIIYGFLLLFVVYTFCY